LLFLVVVMLVVVTLVVVMLVVVMLVVVMLGVVMLVAVMLVVVMLCVVMPGVVMLGVVILGVVLLSVAAALEKKPACQSLRFNLPVSFLQPHLLFTFYFPLIAGMRSTFSTYTSVKAGANPVKNFTDVIYGFS
jgi:hypothetical protein